MTLVYTTKPEYNADRYTYQAKVSHHGDQNFVATCEEFPNLYAMHHDQEEALATIRNQVADKLEHMRATGENPPEPASNRKKL